MAAMSAKPTEPIMHFASGSPVKLAAAAAAGFTVVPHIVKSKVPDQPFGDQIEQGALNRLNAISFKYLNAASSESGIDDGQEVNVVALRYRGGVWIETCRFSIPEEYYTRYTGAKTKKTFGKWLVEIGKADDHADWYRDVGYDQSRSQVIERLLRRAVRKSSAWVQHIPKFPLESQNFRDVNYLDVGDAFSEKMEVLVDGMHAVTRHLNFEYIVGLEMRGIPLAIALARRFSGVKVVMARKGNKLPGKKFGTGELVKAYKDTNTEMFIQEDRLPEGATVLIVDDIVESAGTVTGVTSAVRAKGHKVVGVACPYVIPFDEHGFRENPGCPVYFAHNHAEKIEKPKRVLIPQNGPLWMSDPATSLELRKLGKPLAPVIWKHFDHGTMELNFAVDVIRGRTIHLVVDTRSPYARYLVEFASICTDYGCTPIIFAPYCDHLTQDRIFETVVDGDRYESLAAGSTTIHRFFQDLPLVLVTPHNVINRLSRKNVTVVDMMPVMMKAFFADHPNVRPVFPDQGAFKRFGACTGHFTKRKPVVCYKRRIGETDEREITVVDELKDGDDYVVTDDLVHTGGTTDELYRYLKSRGARHIYCLLVHMSGSGKSIGRLAKFDGGVTTNTTFGRVPEGWKVINVYDHI